MERTVIRYRPGTYPELEAAVLTGLAAGSPVVLDLDLLETLDVVHVRELIALLRRGRAAGGEFALQSTNAAVRGTLALTALDRLFPLMGEAAA